MKLKLNLSILLPFLALSFFVLAFIFGSIITEETNINTFKHIEAIGSGFQRLKHFAASALYLQLDDYHHIEMFQGIPWTEVTDYLPQMWLISKLDPTFTDVYTDAAYHLAINLDKVEEGMKFITEGIQNNSDALDVRFEYVYLLWQTETASPQVIIKEAFVYRNLFRKQNGDIEDPYNEPSSATIIAELLNANADSLPRIAQLYTNRSIFIREALRIGVYYPGYFASAPSYMKPLEVEVTN